MSRPANPPSRQTTRYELRVLPKSLEQWQRAADAREQLLSEFVREACDAQAAKVLRAERRAKKRAKA